MDETEDNPLRKSSGRVQDPNPERIRHLAELFYRFASNKVSVADVAGLSRKRLRQLTEVGHTKLRYGRLDEATEIFKALARVDHKNYYYRSALGGVYQKLKKWVEAVANYTIAIRLNPHDTASLVNRGEIFLRHDKYKKAAEDFRNAILADKQGKNLWANRARSLVIALKRSIEAKKEEKGAVMKVLPAKRTATRKP
jgi:Flp pilus assembly protein TadD